MSFQPELASAYGRVNASFVPPHGFITATMDFMMMTSAQRNGKFVTDLSSNRSALCEAEVVSIRRSPAADQTWVSGNKLEVLAVTKPARLGQREDALVDRRFGTPAILWHLRVLGP